ncbi:hypothetical protein AALP_AA6G079600 [Arabis alpina]|uniref:RBR-type E3 ubiquitin transferase n=1 Tax=Arabis alpina TaxID=50452 RepID=A0A087GMT3_ARAAL|nr:hypothetical protein AALP_AA6G079600 [Arabis alpina]
MSYSDDDMLDNDSAEDNYHYTDDDDGKDPYYEEYFEDDSVANRSQIGYVALKEADIQKHQRDDIEQVSTILSISQAEAIALLLHYRWSVSKIEDEWFTDEARVRSLVGILKEPVLEYNNRGGEGFIECGICFEAYVHKDMARVSCGHPYCVTCWTGYIAAKIDEGPGCLKVKCPEPSCCAAIGQDLIDKVSSQQDKEKYDRFLLRSYIEDSGKKIKWCPSPGCEYAVDLFGSGSENYDVSCLCSYSFCWNCSEDAHSPVDCDTVSHWIFKNNDESENTKWILVNTKPCPRCKRSIEKNEGCMHMTCTSPCKYEFCWTCLGDWDDGNHRCHKFRDDETETEREMAKKAIDRYVHYYERWAYNQSSRLKAMECLEKLQSEQLKKLSYKQSTSETHLQFTLDAWIQIIECRRVLKWTYAYGYYLPSHEHAKKQLFEYSQGEAEAGLERLHHCAELELNHFVSDTEDSPQNFSDFRNKLIGLTKVTKSYFENLVKALENGLADVTKSSTDSKSSCKRQKTVGVSTSSTILAEDERLAEQIQLNLYQDMD